MSDLNITNEEFNTVEKLLLPDGCNFPDDAKQAIMYFDSTDIVACPGSGKTTALLAKLKILANRMPFKNNAGVCVLSHTNVAIDEIKLRLPEDANKLLGYPNFVGTIQTFIDRFIVLPYIRTITSEPLQVVDDGMYGDMLNAFLFRNKDIYQTLINFSKSKFRYAGNRFENLSEYMKDLHIINGELFHQRSKIAGENADSTKQYCKAKKDFLKQKGGITYRDAYLYAEEAIEKRSEIIDLITKRFRYVFIDEYQDCSSKQRELISCIFDDSISKVFKIGDPDQSIYNNFEQNNEMNDWKPKENSLNIETSSRYTQEIADVISPLRVGKQRITSLKGEQNIYPALIIFDNDSIAQVIPKFMCMLEKYKLYDDKGIYKAIGWIKSETSTGLKIGDYCTEYDYDSSRQSVNTYWSIINEIYDSLKCRKLYKVEELVREIICKILYFNDYKQLNGVSYTVTSVKEHLDTNSIYRNLIINLAINENKTIEELELNIRKMINDVVINESGKDVYDFLPEYFMKKDICRSTVFGEKNVAFDPIRGRRIQICTIHKVKGETHDATLYLETERSGVSDIKRIIPYLKNEKPGASSLFDYSRKCAYVGFSRPRTLLCVTIHENTYTGNEEIFRNWDIVDCRESE